MIFAPVGLSVALTYAKGTVKARLLRCNDTGNHYIPHTLKGLESRPLHREILSMFVTEALAQTSVPASGSADIIMSILPFILIFIIMYFLIIRPQRQQMKKRDETLSAMRRGDTVVLGGGIVGKVTKVTDGVPEVEVEIANGVKVTAIRSLIAEVRVKGEPVAANQK
jgi:preprotein translocase subunit YajC